MKLDKQNLSQDLQEGLDELKRYGFLTFGEEGREVYAQEGSCAYVSCTENKIEIIYDRKSHFYMALARGIGSENGEYSIEPKMKELGFMMDCSRNAVPTIETVKRLICILALAGYTYLELYTEDTYELPGEPYFGYMRGRYRTEELKEIIRFAEIFGIQMVPCIQTLAHLKNLANWYPYGIHMDIDDILMVDDERTYTLIRKMLNYCMETFQTKRIHIGMDEAFHLGRGRYIDENGYRPKNEVFLRHLKRVFEICKELGAEPEFWADGLYDTDLSIEELRSLFDGSQTPVYWEYSQVSPEPHQKKMEQLKSYAGKVIYAGACWKCLGFAPNNLYSDTVTNAAFQASVTCGVEDMLMTTWGDNGAECSVFTLLPSIWHTANLVYRSEADMDVLFKELTGYTEKEWRYCDRINKIRPEQNKLTNAAKYMFYNDYLMGLMDENTPDDAVSAFEKMLPEYEKLAERNSDYAYLFQTYATLCRVLVHKADFGKRLYKAYQEQNREMLHSLIDELGQIRQDMQSFYEQFRRQWMAENKDGGFEISDVRIGGMIARTDTVRYLLEAYLSGKQERIYELEEERLDYFCGRLGEGSDTPLHNHWETLFTVNHF